MIKRLLTILCLLSSTSYAGLITHTDYTSGNTITAAGQNANENVIVNEMNGNLNSANLLDGGVSTADLADAGVTKAKLSSDIQSTMTYVNQWATYRKPNLNFNSTTSVAISTNSITSNTSCVIFPDGQVRCVTEDIASTDKYRLARTNASASFTTGTEDSGMAPNETVANDTWYAVYAVKSLINTSNFVLAFSTNTPIAINFTRLNGIFNTNGWSYLGMIKYGDNASNNVVLSFNQTGTMTLFTNVTSGNALNASGIRLVSTAGAAGSTYTYTSSGVTAIPTHVSQVTFCVAVAGSAGFSAKSQASSSLTRLVVAGLAGPGTFACEDNLATDGIAVVPASSVATDIFLLRFWDPILGSGLSPSY